MLVTLSCLCMLAESTALAAAPGLLEEITVIATRREARLETVAAAVSVIPGERVREEQLVIDALDATVGGYVQQTTPGQGAAIIRGLRGSALLHLVDGMRLNNAIFRSAPTQYFAFLPSGAIERLEVIRGTPASLYGSDAVGGVVQAVTRRPDFDSDETSTSGEVYARYRTADETRRLGGTLDVGSVNGYVTASVDWLKTGDRRTGGGVTVAPSGFEARAARLAAGLTPASGNEWLVDVHYYEQPSTPRVDELVPGFGQVEPGSAEFFFEPNARWYANLRHLKKSGALDWTFSLAWQRIDDDRRTRNLGSSERRLEGNRSDLVGALITAGSTTASGSWLAGVELYADRVSSSRIGEDINSGALLPLVPRFPDGSELLEGSAFVNGTRSIGDRIALSGGLRFSEFEIRLAETSLTPATTLTTGDFAGDLGLIVDVADDWQWIANVGYGFRAPNIFDLGALGNRPGNRFNVPNPDLASETVLQLDAGVRHTGDRWQLDAFVYTLDYRDRITSVGTGEVTPSGRDIVRSENAAESRIAGLEAGLVVALGDSMSLSAVLNYTRATQSVRDGEDEPGDRIPPLSGRLALLYDAGGAWLGEAWVGFADRQARLSARDVADSRIDPAGTAGWGIVGARVEWRPSDRWRLDAELDNLLDKRYRVHGSGIDAPGRNLTLGVYRAF